MKNNRPIPVKSSKRPLKIADTDSKREKRAFADPKALLNKDNEPASRVEDRLREAASPAEDRSATSL